LGQYPLTRSNPDEAVLSAAEMSRLGQAKTRQKTVLKDFLEGLRPIVKEEEPSLEVDNDLISFKTWDDSFPLWVTEKLHLGDWTSLTQTVWVWRLLGFEST
jgi:hypothetical protein